MHMSSMAFFDGRRLRCLNIVDAFTKECLSVEADTSLRWLRTLGVLEQLAEIRRLSRGNTMETEKTPLKKSVCLCLRVAAGAVLY